MGKALKSITKVATLGLSGTKLGQSALGSLSGGLLGTDPAAAAAKQAADAQAEVARQQALIQTNASALQANSAVDNTASVIAGGSADASAIGAGDTKRKRVGSLSSTLGV
jgi:hypothetical protein